MVYAWPAPVAKPLIESNPQQKWPVFLCPQIQLLHCIKQADGDGGDNTLVDRVQGRVRPP